MRSENVCLPEVALPKRKPSLPSRLRRFVKADGRALTWLSKRTGIQYDRLCRVSRGEDEPTLREAILIKLALLCEFEEVFDTNFQLPPWEDDHD